MYNVIVQSVVNNLLSLPVGQPPVLKLLSKRFWGLSIYILAWNLARQRGPSVVPFLRWEANIRSFCPLPPKKTKNCQLFCPTGVNPLPSGEIHRVYAGNWSTEVVNILVRFGW